MGNFLTVIVILACVLLVLLILVQNPKGGGFSTDFGSTGQLGSVKQTNDFIENATWGLAGLIAVISIAMTLMYHTPTVTEEPMQQQTTEQPVGSDVGTSGEITE